MVGELMAAELETDVTWLSELDGIDEGTLTDEEPAVVSTNDVTESVSDTLVPVVITTVVAVSVTLMALSVGEVTMSLVVSAGTPGEVVPGDKEVVSCRLSQPMVTFAPVYQYWLRNRGPYSFTHLREEPDAHSPLYTFRLGQHSIHCKIRPAYRRSHHGATQK